MVKKRVGSSKSVEDKVTKSDKNEAAKDGSDEENAGKRALGQGG